MCAHEQGKDPFDCSHCRRDSEAMRRTGDDDFISERDDPRSHDPNRKN